MSSKRKATASKPKNESPLPTATEEKIEPETKIAKVDSPKKGGQVQFEIGNEYAKFTTILNSPEFSSLTEASALSLLNTTPRDCFVILTLPLTNSLVWQVSTVFKSRTQYFPAPSTSFNAYTLELLRGWCFHEGRASPCNHRGCLCVFRCLSAANDNNLFYSALYTSVNRTIPKTTASSILSGKFYNKNYDIVTVNEDQFVIHPYEGMVYYGYNPITDCTVTAHELLLNQGSNIYPIFNRRTTPFSSDLHNERFYPSTFSYTLTVNGDVDIKSTMDTCADVRLSVPLLKRKFNYETKFNEKNYVFGSFSLDTFKDSIHLNRVQTQSYIEKLISFLGGFPLDDEYKPKTTEDDLTRSFYFLYSPEFDCDKLVRLYETVFKLKSLLAITFAFNVEFTPKIKLPLLSMVESTYGGELDGQVIVYKKLVPLRLAKTKSTPLPISMDEENYLLIKPTGFTLAKLNELLDVLFQMHVGVEDIKARMLTDYEFNRLYPTCMTRVYGPDWRSHMFSGLCLVIKTKHTTYETIRCAAMLMRRKSGIPWVKNVVHSAATQKERELMLELFRGDFEVQPPLNNLTCMNI